MSNWDVICLECDWEGQRSESSIPSGNFQYAMMHCPKCKSLSVEIKTRRMLEERDKRRIQKIPFVLGEK